MLFSLPAFRDGKHDQLIVPKGQATFCSLFQTKIAEKGCRVECHRRLPKYIPGSDGFFFVGLHCAFEETARAFGVENWVIAKFKERNLNTFGRFAFAVAFNPQNQNDKPFVDYVENLAESTLGQDQLAALRRLFFESHTLALADVRIRVESSPDPSTASRKLPTAERLARQTAQQCRLGGIIFNPDTIPANQLVDTFVEMLEHNTLSYVKPEQCISRAQEVSAVKKDPTIATDSQGMLKIATKNSAVSLEANSELKLRAALQRRSLAMDLAGIASYDVVSQMLREQPRGFSKSDSATTY